MAHFVNQNQYSKPKPEFHSKSGPVKAEKGGEAKQKFQLENPCEQSLAFGQQHGNRADRAQTLRPFVFTWLDARLYLIGQIVERARMMLDPTGLF